MNTQRVLAAAGVLGEFTLDEVAAFCDESPSAIVAVFDGAPGVVERVEPGRRWRVVDADVLRQSLQVHSRPPPTESHHRKETDRVHVSPATRLLLAEETLFGSAAEQSAPERRLMISTARNHLRQVVAQALPQRVAWWDLELSPERLGAALERHPDTETSTRLQLDVAMTYLAEGTARGRPVPTAELVDTVLRFQRLVPVLGGPRLLGLVGRFVDLVMAQLVPPGGRPASAPGRLIAALARRRVRVQVDRDVGAAMQALVPLVSSLGKAGGGARPDGLYQMLGRLPDGRDRVVVYADLLALLPGQFTWQFAGERLPGALVEALTDPNASSHLRWCARALEHDLVHSPFGSESALIGQAAHVFQELAEWGAGFDDSVLARGDRTRSELLTLARAAVWPATNRAEQRTAGS